MSGQIAAAEPGGAVAPQDGFGRTAPSAVGVDADQVAAFLNEVEAAGLDIHSFMLHRHGQVCAEAWRWPYRADRPRILHSTAKSFTACAIGLAVEEKRLALSDKVISFFPEHAPEIVSDHLAAMTVEDLLTMRTGQASETSGAVWRGIHTSWIAEFFKIPLPHAPGAKYVYTSAASYMLSAIISRVTGMTLHDYLKPRLFAPLGITGEAWDIGPDGVNPGGNGLTARTADLLKLGVLHAQGGAWGDTQVLPASWVRAATREHGGDGSQYGYHWATRPAGAYSAIGVFVQFVTVFPEYGVTLAMTAAMENSGRIFPHVMAHLVPAFAGPGSAQADARLKEKLAAWPLPPQPVSYRSSLPKKITGRVYAIAPNAAGVTQVRLDFDGDACVFRLTDAAGEHSLRAGLGHGIESPNDMPGRDLHHGYTLAGSPVVAQAAWVDEQTLKMHWIFAETAFRDTVTCIFEGDRITVRRGVNVNSGALNHPDLLGLAAPL
jgi:CubicO group peptidase (beta-lactamase class C family)